MDESTYGFNKPDAEELINLIGGKDADFPEINPGQRSRCPARWALFHYTPESETPPDVVAFYDGPDPDICLDPVELAYPLGEPPCECDILAFWDPNVEKYQAHSTKAATLGEPTTMEQVTEIANADCGIDVSKVEMYAFPTMCSNTPTTETIELGTETPLVVSIASDACGKISYAVQPARVFICGNTIDTVELPLNFDGVSFVTGAEFGPPDCGGAVYEWQYTGGLDQWVLITACECGEHTPPAPAAPGTPTGTRTTVACTAPANSLCGLNLTLATICADTGSYGYTPTTVHVPLPLLAREVVTDVVDTGVAGDPLEIHYETVYVCNYTDERTENIDTEDCGTSGSSGG